MIRNGIATIFAVILIAATPVAPLTPITASESTIERQYLSIEFSRDGKNLLLHIIDINLTEPKAWSGYIELHLNGDRSFRALEYDCDYRLRLARYMPDGDNLIYALDPPYSPEKSPNDSNPLLIGSDLETGDVKFSAEAPRASLLDLAISDDGQTIYVAYQIETAPLGDAVIFRYHVDSGIFEKVFDNFFRTNIRFISFLEATDAKVSFRASKDFSDLTQEDIDLLGQPGLVMIDESYLLFETTDDTKVAILSSLYPSLKQTLESYTDRNSQWPTTIYYFGAAAQYEFGQMHVAFAMPASSEQLGTVSGIYKVEEDDVALVLEPGFDFERFAVSSDGRKMAFVHRLESGAATITLFERSSDVWTAHSLESTLHMIKSVDPCTR